MPDEVVLRVHVKLLLLHVADQGRVADLETEALRISWLLIHNPWLRQLSSCVSSFQIFLPTLGVEGGRTLSTWLGPPVVFRIRFQSSHPLPPAFSTPMMS